MAALIGIFRNLEKEANQLIGEKELDEEITNKIVVLLSTLKSESEQTQNIQEQNIDLLDANELQQAIQESTTFEISASEIILRVEKFIKSITKNSRDEVESTKSSGVFIYSSVKLPRLQVKKFDGDILNWNAFHDSFVAAVHHSNISNVEK